jgi:hypothetical protein
MTVTADEREAAAAVLAAPHDPGAAARLADALTGSAPDPRAAALALARAHPHSPGPALVYAELSARAGNRARAQFVRDAVVETHPDYPHVIVCDAPPADPGGGYALDLPPGGREGLRVGGRYFLREKLPDEVTPHTPAPRIVPAEFVGASGGVCRFASCPDPVLTGLAEATRRHFVNGMTWLGALHEELGARVYRPVVRFGLLFEFECAWAVWRAHAAKLLAAHPVSRVRVLDGPDPEAFEELVGRHAARLLPAILAAALSRDAAGSAEALARAACAAEWPEVAFELPAWAVTSD